MKSCSLIEDKYLKCYSIEKCVIGVGIVLVAYLVECFCLIEQGTSHFSTFFHFLKSKSNLFQNSE